MVPPTNLIKVLASATCPVIIGHVNPDADAMGSMLALARAMPADDVAIALPQKSRSQKVTFVVELGDGIPIADETRIARADVVIVVDTANINRVNVTGHWAAVADKTVVNIDHHITNTDFGHFNWVVDNAGSTSELIHRLILAADWPLDSMTASLLYAGIYADTGGFSLPNVTAESFDACAALVRAGADVAHVASRLFRSQEQHEFNLIRAVYHNTRLAGNGRIAYGTLTHNEIQAAGCTPDDIDDQVSIPRSLSGIQIAILFSEGVPGIVRINLRGEEGTTILPLAEKLGGGGHAYSAGARVRGDFGAIVDRVLRAATEFLDQPHAPNKARSASPKP